MISNEQKWVRVELHLHTRISKDSLVKIEELLERCDRIGIDHVAITDHNQIENALKAKAMAPDRVIVGEEIETTQGELIGYFMTEQVPPGLEPMAAIDRLRKQGALISVAHPLDTTRTQHWDEEELLAIAPYVDAIESFNARCLTNKPNQAAETFAQKHGLLETVGSDAHSLWEVGRAYLTLPEFDDAAEFKAGLVKAEKTTRLSPFFVHLFSRYAVLHKKLSKIFQ